MARSRNIKPGFFTNDQLAELPALTRLLFVGLWTIADREGRLEDRPKKIKAEAMPYDSFDCDDALSELQSSGFIIRYTTGGIKVIQVVNWCKHQNPHVKEQPSTLPEQERHQTSTVQAPDKQQPSTEVAGLIPDSGFLIPDSSPLIPSSVAKATGDKSPAEQSKTELWKAAVSLLSGQGMPEPQARSFVGKLSKDYPDGDIVLDAVRATVTEQPADARAYLKATCQQMAGERSPARPTFAQQAADISRTTVPAKPGRDPVLLEIERHSAKAAPIPESIREKLQALKGGVLQ